MLKEDDLAGVYSEFASVIGVEATIEIYETFKGQQITFPNKLHSTKYLKTKIKEEYNEGASIKDLAHKYGYTNRWIREMIKQ